MPRLTIFSWGYHGWGHCARQFVRAADVVEKSRGFKPPIFVDIRIRRTGRAPDMQNDTFERIVGKDRYAWMPDLGNRQAVDHSLPRIKIERPAAANKLLDMAVKASRAKRRVIFMCWCPTPLANRVYGPCHRSTVATLLLKAATRAGRKIEVVEWPAGEPIHTKLRASRQTREAVAANRKYIPIGSKMPDAEWLALPWGSIVEIPQADGADRLLAAGPARLFSGQWTLPRIAIRSKDQMKTLTSEAQTHRKRFGYEPRRN